MNKSEVVVLLSGGIDSTACLHFYQMEKYTITPLYVDFGQISAENEISSARAVCQYYGLELKILELKLKEFKDGEISGRNAFLLMAALMYFNQSCGLVSIGLHKGTAYKDCSPDFVKKIQQIFDLYHGGAIKVGAPFLCWDKSEIWDYCIYNKVPINLTYSCELGDKQPCGKCISCNDLKILYAN